MNESNNESDLPDVDEQRLVQLLRGVEEGTAAPDPSRMSDIREKLLATLADTSPTDRDIQDDKQPRSLWVRSAWRGVAALAAVAAALFIAINLFLQDPAHAEPFSKILEDLRNAKSLELRIKKEGKDSQVF